MSKDVILIYGKNPIREAISADKVIRLFLVTGFHDESILSLMKSHHITPTYVSSKELNGMIKDVNHQGLVAEIKPFSYISVEELLIKIKKSNRKIPFILMLDGISDPQNLGAIIRSADVFGVDGIIIGKHNQVPLNATVAKTSAGAIHYVPVALANNLNNAIKVLKEKGYWIVSADGEGTIYSKSMEYNFPIVLVIGSEGYGVSKLILKNSDYVIKIRMVGHVNSLNASVAAGILMENIADDLNHLV